jgi:hypothetical protein
LRWIGIAVLVVTTLATVNGLAVAGENRRFSDALHVPGVVAASYTDSLTVPVSYRNPTTGGDVEARYRVAHYDERPRGGERIDLLVDRDDPTSVRRAGAEANIFADIFDLIGLAALLCLVPAIVRLRTARAVRRLIAADTVTFAMLASVGSRRFWRRPLLRLYPLDARPGSPPVCVVPLAWSDGLCIGGAAFPVEVKGSPRPFGLVVARLDSGAVLWPAGRALAVRGPGQSSGMPAERFNPRHPVSSGTRWPLATSPATSKILAFANIAAVLVSALVTLLSLSGAREAATVRKRSQHATALVLARSDSRLTVRYFLGGDGRRASVPIGTNSRYTKGVLYPALVDPASGAVRMAKDPYSPAEPIGTVWVLTAVLTATAVRRPLRRRRLWRASSSGPVRQMWAEAREVTLRSVVVRLREEGDRSGGHCGIVLMPRRLMNARGGPIPVDGSVQVQGALNGSDTPLLGWGGTCHVPSSKMRFTIPVTARPGGFVTRSAPVGRRRRNG